jgi:hypothetical protein
MARLRMRYLVLVCLLCAAGRHACAQGPPQYLWTWNSGSGLFQGSFETPADYLTPNISIANGLYNLSFTSPDRTWTSNGNLSGDHTLFSYYGDSSFSITVYDPSGEQIQAGPFAMSAVLNNQILFGETGSWSITEIPEPSATSVLAVGVLAWCAKEKKRKSLFCSIGVHRTHI